MINILDDLKYRGLINNYSNEKEIEQLLETPQTIYCGFDPSASSLHVGNFLMISLLMRLQNVGHRVIALVGGATGMIGDPSGKNKERNLLDKETTLHNVECIKAQLAKYIDISNETKGLLLNNYDWLSKISILDYLRDIGKFFPVNYMLAKDIVSSRIESGISFTEFTYMTLQATDFLTLYRNYNCRIQVGGGDQWGNLTTGLELIRKAESDAKVGVFTLHLITTSDGKKFGKSEKGALYLDKSLTSPYEIYQYFYNTTDDDSIRYLKLFTMLNKEEIEGIKEEHYANPGKRIAQKALAFQMVFLIHGEEDAKEALYLSEALFKEQFADFSKEQLELVFSSMKVEVQEDLLIEDLLVKINAASSKREAREFILGNAVMINGEKKNVIGTIISKKNALHNCYSVVKRGKKNYYLVKHI